jgi:hypothetical protein
MTEDRWETQLYGRVLIHLSTWCQVLETWKVAQV